MMLLGVLVRLRIRDPLSAAIPAPRTELEYANPFTLLVAVVLSAQASSFVCPEELEAMLVGVVDKTSTYETLRDVIEAALLQETPQDAEPNGPVAALTPRQRQIFSLIGQGLSNKAIAHATGLAVATVETHRKAIASRLNCSGAELVRRAALDLGPVP